MIKIDNNYIQLDTVDTSSLMRVNEYGDIEQLYYGDKIDFGDRAAITPNRSVLLVNTVYPIGDESYGIDAINLSFSSGGIGDFRKPACVCMELNGNNIEFVYSGYRLGCTPSWLSPHTPNGWSDSIVIDYSSIDGSVSIELWYLVYEGSNVIARATRVTNNGSEITVNKLSSLQLDIEANERQLVSFNGAWGREQSRKITDLNVGIVSHGADNGLSSAECNPFFMIKDRETTQHAGNAYGFNLVYSGSHVYSVETSVYNGMRILSGIASSTLNYHLKAGECMTSPFAVMTHSSRGLNGVSGNMHDFIYNHIIPREAITPIMLNTWEAMYFDISEEKIMAVATKAKELAFDGVVIDDGWFLSRNDDTSSLGDWVEDKIKFPNGIFNLASRVKDMGLLFGIWIEPEMVSENSNLYRQHPDWALKSKVGRDIVGRNQYILDITRSEVADYVYDSIVSVVSSYGADYLKWDFNRRFSNVVGERDSYSYDYAVALDGILSRLIAAYPKLYLEVCASGGGRFDLGMLSYSHIVWTSDNTNALSRIDIQEGTSYGYPVATMLSHLSASPNHQTQRIMTRQTAADVAKIGAYGTQLNILQIDDDYSEFIRRANSDYRSTQQWLARAKCYRVVDGQTSNQTVWQVMASNGECGRVMIYHKKFDPVSGGRAIKLVGLEPNALYNINGHKVNITAHGTTLMSCGMVLPQNYQGHTMTDKTLKLVDNTTLSLNITRIGGNE